MNLNEKFDSVIFFTHSNWKTEPRSNRYHFATRFARHLPVYFIQTDYFEWSFDISFEETEIPNVTIIYVPRIFDEKIHGRLLKFFHKKGIKNPLYWIYNWKFSDFFLSTYSPLRVYHATEDYFDPFLRVQIEDSLVELRKVLNSVDLIVTVSQGLADSYRKETTAPVVIAENGVDYAFWGHGKAKSRDEKIAIYQGGVNSRLDFKLIQTLVTAKRDWTFIFCGVVDDSITDISWLREQSNVQVLGPRPLEEIRELCLKASVGLMPYKDSPFIRKSLPLKTFEYLATGLPVASVPIDSLKTYEGTIYFYNSADQLLDFLSRPNLGAGEEKRKEVARNKDYDLTFGNVISEILKKEPTNFSLQISVPRPYVEIPNPPYRKVLKWLYYFYRDIKVGRKRMIF